MAEIKPYTFFSVHSHTLIEEACEEGVYKFSEVWGQDYVKDLLAGFKSVTIRDIVHSNGVLGGAWALKLIRAEGKQYACCRHFLRDALQLFIDMYDFQLDEFKALQSELFSCTGSEWRTVSSYITRWVNKNFPITTANEFIREMLFDLAASRNFETWCVYSLMQRVLDKKVQLRIRLRFSRLFTYHFCNTDVK